MAREKRKPDPPRRFPPGPVITTWARIAAPALRTPKDYERFKKMAAIIESLHEPEKLQRPSWPYKGTESNKDRLRESAEGEQDEEEREITEDNESEREQPFTEEDVEFFRQYTLKKRQEFDCDDSDNTVVLSTTGTEETLSDDGVVSKELAIAKMDPSQPAMGESKIDVLDQ
ncbi:hypothetical protein UCRPC4_g06589 [Phaeomoniella chlamydospora]|uniref:Uncharacterized protein n=1 Tax=Phaeomoniella chlamydospora TaxID=158046 RepID=A0A0G2DWD4_PHACM|nr:hypothetical protein UCRPC4_g06589 [Phaeomoniella chlamydospora]